MLKMWLNMIFTGKLIFFFDCWLGLELKVNGVFGKEKFFKVASKKNAEKIVKWKEKLECQRKM